MCSTIQQRTRLRKAQQQTTRGTHDRQRANPVVLLSPSPLTETFAQALRPLAQSFSQPTPEGRGQRAPCVRHARGMPAGMQACRHAGMLAGMPAGLQACLQACLQPCLRPAGMQACRHAGMQACRHAGMQACLQACRGHPLGRSVAQPREPRSGVCRALKVTRSAAAVFVMD